MTDMPVTNMQSESGGADWGMGVPRQSLSRSGAVAARVAHNHEVAGSSPASATTPAHPAPVVYRPSVAITLLPPHRDCFSSEYPLNGIQFDAGVVVPDVSSMFLLSCNLVGPVNHRAFFYYRILALRMLTNFNLRFVRS